MSHHVSFYLFWVATKVQRLVFAICWRLFMLVYFTIGLGALALLFLIEAQFFLHVTHHPLLGYGIAAIFEVAKVGTSMIKQAITIANRVTRVKVAPLIQGLTVLAQIALIGVSLVCSVVIITAYLEGTSPDPESLFARNPGANLKPTTLRLPPAVVSTLTILKSGLHLDVKPETFLSLFALVLSALFQATSFIVFGHLIAMQSREIEHIFELKMARTEAKKNFGLTT
jgi:hypothetical protein